MKDIRGELPTWEEKKDLLYNRDLAVDTDFLLTLAHRLEKAGRLSDALAFHHRAGNVGGGEALRDRAVEEGNFFLYAQTVNLFELDEDPDAVRRLARNAMERGRFAYAHRAFLAAGDEAEAREALERLRALLPDARLLFEKDEEP